jgi:hypothetical protein
LSVNVTSPASLSTVAAAPSGAPPARSAWIFQAISFPRSSGLGRRNLTPYQRAELALKLEDLVAARAKANQREHGGTAPGRKNTFPMSGEVDR